MNLTHYFLTYSIPENPAFFGFDIPENPALFEFDIPNPSKEFHSVDRLIGHQMTEAPIVTSSDTNHDKDKSKSINSKVEKKFHCTICDYFSSSETNLSRHTRKHTGDKPFECHVCDKRFARTDHLKKHLQVHGKLLPFNCSVCNREFSLKHKKDAHETKCELRFGCGCCNYRTADLIKLRKHVERHTINPYSSFNHQIITNINTCIATI